MLSVQPGTFRRFGFNRRGLLCDDRRVKTTRLASVARFVNISCLIALSCAASASAAPAVTPKLKLDIHVRALVPGEPMRIVASSSEPLTSVTGKLHGTALTFVPVGDGAPATSWSAWSVLDLDWPAGALPLVVRGKTASGVESSGTLRVALGHKSFPISTLKVESKYVNPPPEVQARIAAENAKLAAVYATRRMVAPPTAPFVRPVPGEPTSVFGARRVFNGEKRKAHPGLDLHAAEGTPVALSGPGVVALAEDLYFSGGTVIVDHGGGLFTVYAHLSRIDVKAGDVAAQGAIVGLSGATGRVTGPHLHWAGKVGNTIFDPTALLDPSLFAPDESPARKARIQ
jgi:hypothetical protein